MSDDQYIKAWLNPLQLLEADEPWASHVKTSLDREAILNFLTAPPGVESDVDNLVKRYKEISNETQRLNVVPAESRILEKLIWPLRNSKASYMVGNYLGTISLCRFGCRMVAMLLFEISELKINQNQMTEDEARSLFGNSFEKLGQNGVFPSCESQISLMMKSKKLSIWFEQTEGNICTFGPKIMKDCRDAVAVYNSTVKIVIRAIGQHFTEGKIVLNPALVKYLKRLGVYELKRKQKIFL